MRTPRQFSKTSSGWRQGRAAAAGGAAAIGQSRGLNFTPAASGGGAPQSIGSLIMNADDAIREAEILRAQIFRKQQQSRRDRMHLEHDVSETIRMDAERLAHEREQLEAELAENMRQLHSLEVAGMEHSTHSREKKKHAKDVACQLRKLRDVDAHDDDAHDVANEGIRVLSGVHRQLEAEAQGIEEQQRRAYEEKERTEADIADRRQALAINEVLLRARYERQMLLPELDEPSSSPDEPQMSMLGEAQVLVLA